MATIASVVNNLHWVPKALEVRPEIKALVDAQNRLHHLASPPSMFPPAFIAGLSSTLPTVPPGYEIAHRWAAQRQRLLQATALFGQFNAFHRLTSEMLQNTTSFLESLPQEYFDRSSQQPWLLTEEDEQRVQGMIEVLAPVVTGRPHDEARAWLSDFVAIGFFAPSTEDCEEVPDEDAVEFFIGELERAFSAAVRAGELWDER